MENVFLIASESKKEEWKQYLDKITGNTIKWVEDTENRDGCYCVIAMKSYIEKREETFREIEEKYSEQLKRAKQVFIFHLKTGISYVDRLEMIQGKKNWYYSVIDLDTGVPAISPHNEQVIKDFKYKLLPGRDTFDEQDNEKPSPSSGEKQLKPKKTPSKNVQTGLEEYRLELKSNVWNGVMVERLKKGILESVGIKSKPKMRLEMLVFGNTGSGKTSLIKSLLNALTGNTWNVLAKGSEKYCTYSFAEGNKQPDLILYEATDTSEDVLYDIIGKKTYDGVIFYLINGATLPEEQGKGKDEWVKDLQNLKTKTDKYDCFRYLVFTHMDIKYPILRGNIEAILKSDEVSGFVEEIHKKTEYPKEFILPVVNSVDTTMTDPYRTYVLYLLLKFVMIAKEAGEKQKQKKIQSLTPSMEPPGGNCSVL